MCVYLYKCLIIYVCVCMYTCICIFLYVYVYVYIYIYWYVCYICRRNSQYEQVDGTKRPLREGPSKSRGLSLEWIRVIRFLIICIRWSTHGWHESAPQPNSWFWRLLRRGGCLRSKWRLVYMMSHDTLACMSESCHTPVCISNCHLREVSHAIF